MHQDAEAPVAFGRFSVLPSRRELLANGRRVELGERAFDVLLALVEARGTVVSKDELLHRVWPGKVVEENNLQAQISTLRKALEPDRDLIHTVAGRGYQFVGQLRSTAAAPFEMGVPVRNPTNLSQPASELIGRDAELAAVIELMRTHRLVTLTGPGGIGKTRLCMDAGRRLLPEVAGGVWIAELGPLSDPQLVPVTVAAALGLTLASADLSPERVAAALGKDEIVLVLDSCEHVIEAAARMAEALMRASPHARVIASSREPLRAPGELVYRVPPLDVPAEDTQHMEDLLRTGAVQLFIARARAAHPQFAPDQRVAEIAAAICRRLDGIPLAIELAAARTAALGLEGLAARLDDRFRLLTGGHRTALPRHQTLRATLDWSYDLLPEAERVVLRRLAAFAGTFSLESASTVAASEALTPPDVVDCILNLVTKSLLPALRGTGAQYRWLETTRAYALEKLAESGELARFARRHAEHYLQVFERAEAEWETRPTAEWLAAYAPQLDNVRAALDWAFSADGDAELGVALTAAVVPLWMRMSLMAECRARIERALESLGPEGAQTTRHGMQLYAGLGLSLMYTIGNVEESRAALTRALEIAERLDDTDYRLRALWALCVERLNSGIFTDALPLAQQFYSVAASSPNRMDLAIGDRMIGMALHWMGDQAGARRLFDRMLSEYVAPVHRSQTLRFVLDQRVSARAVLAEVLWLQGFPDQAMRMTESNIAQALATDHALSLCNALAKACPIALFAGDMEALERYAAMLLDHSARNALASWEAEAHCFQAVLKVRRGEVATGDQVLRPAVEELREIKFALRYTSLLGDLAELLGRAGEVEQGLAEIGEALERSERNQELWCRPELLRIKGELRLLERGGRGAQAAEQLFREGLDLARKQAVPSWELRCATSLARLWCELGRSGPARELLAPVYSRFTEGFETADLKSAKALLDAPR
jgi:predicted ATPase